MQQPVVAGTGVAALVGEDGVELVAGETVQGTRGDDQLGRTAGHPPGVGVLVLEDQEGTAGGGQAGRQIGGAFAQMGAGLGAAPACLDEFAREHRGRPGGAAGQQQSEGGGPRRGGGEVVRRGHGRRRRGEELGADRAEHGGGAQGEGCHAAQQDGGDQALPHPQRNHRFPLGPRGPGQRPGHGHGGRHGDNAQQEQADGHCHGLRFLVGRGAATGGARESGCCAHGCHGRSARRTGRVPRAGGHTARRPV